jgi:large subunit ribosomal protein L29
MAKSSFHDLDDGALIDQVTDAKDQLFKLRFQLATGQLSNYARIGQVRKDIARLETELRAREIAAAEALTEENA